MQISKEQKQILITSGALVIVLFFVLTFSKRGFNISHVQIAGNPDQKVIDSQAYLDYLNNVKTDPEASKQLFEKVLTKEDVQREVDLALQTSQPISPPEVDEKNLNISKDSGQQALVDYLTNTIGPIASFNQKTQELNKSIFSGDANVPEGIRSEYLGLTYKLQNVTIPDEAVQLHKSLLAAFSSYGELLKTAALYDKQPSADPWPAVYKIYAEINQSSQVFNQEFQKLSSKYKLASLPPLHYSEKNESGNFATLVPPANALFGFGDFSITVGDIPRLIMDAVKEGLVSSFSKFMAAFLEKMINKIEQNYMVANFLYYSDALVSGQYTDDYLKKYIQDEFDRRVIKQFVPQLSCGQQPQNLKPVFEAKASTYLGFDPTNIDPADPAYYSKLTKVGDFLSQPSGWKTYYEDLASQAEGVAQQSAERELTSSGLKTPRDTIKNAISSSINSIVSAEQAGFHAILNLGIGNTSSFISAFVSAITENLINKFVFRGAIAGDNSSIAVLKEQSTCLAAAQLQMVLPTGVTQYQQPPPAPNPSDLIDQACAGLPRGCDTGVGGNVNDGQVEVNVDNAP